MRMLILSLLRGFGATQLEAECSGLLSSSSLSLLSFLHCCKLVCAKGIIFPKAKTESSLSLSLVPGPTALVLGTHSL